MRIKTNLTRSINGLREIGAVITVNNIALSPRELLDRFREIHIYDMVTP